MFVICQSLTLTPALTLTENHSSPSLFALQSILFIWERERKCEQPEFQVGFIWVSFLILTQILPWPSWHKTDFANVSNDLTWSKNAIFQNKSRIIKLVLWKIFFPCSPVYVARLRQMVGWSATQINAFPIWVHLRVTGAPGIWVRSNIELFCRLDEDEEGEKDKENEEDEED